MNSIYEENGESIEYVSDSNYIPKVFLWMFMGIFATVITSLFTYFSGAIVNIAVSGAYSIILLAELIVAFSFSLFFRKLSPTAAAILYFVYAILSGISLSVIYAMFQVSSIIIVFIGTSLFFGALALYGYITKKDLSKIGTILAFMLFAIIITSFVNLFFSNEQTLIPNLVVDVVTIFVFTLFTIIDMQKIKMLEGTSQKAHIYGAMQLYLDFINLFLRFLSLFAKRK